MRQFSKRDIDQTYWGLCHAMFFLDANLEEAIRLHTELMLRLENLDDETRGTEFEVRMCWNAQNAVKTIAQHMMDRRIGMEPDYSPSPF